MPTGEKIQLDKLDDCRFTSKDNKLRASNKRMIISITIEKSD